MWTLDRWFCRLEFIVFFFFPFFSLLLFVIYSHHEISLVVLVSRLELNTCFPWESIGISCRKTHPVVFF